jgi:ATP synthase protein I
MTDPQDKPPVSGRDFAARVGQQATRRLKALRSPRKGVWFGLGMMGLIGWSIVIPSLFGAAIGQWMDRRHISSGSSWTLALLVAGLLLGCWNAWRWVSSQDKAMQEDSDNDDE